MIAPSMLRDGAVASSPDPYDALAPIYDAWQEAAGTPFSHLVQARLEPLLAREAERRRTFAFADLGCGTGALLHALRAAHPAWRLCGVDASAAMLSQARRRDGSESTSWLRGRLESTLTPDSVDAAGAFFDALNHLPDEATLDRALASAARAIRPGGVFVFDMTNRGGFERWWRGRGAWSGAGWKLETELSWDASRSTAHGHIAVTCAGTSTTAEIVERCFDAPAIRAALAAAGLEVAANEPWSPFAMDDPGKTWWVARKPG